MVLRKSANLHKYMYTVGGLYRCKCISTLSNVAYCSICFWYYCTLKCAQVDIVHPLLQILHLRILQNWKADGNLCNLVHRLLLQKSIMGVPVSLVMLSRWSGDVMKRPGHKKFNAVSHNRSRPEVLFLNVTWRSWGQILSVLLQLLLFAFSNRKFGRHGKWSVPFWQWESNT